MGLAELAKRLKSFWCILLVFLLPFLLYDWTYSSSLPKSLFLVNVIQLMQKKEIQKFLEESKLEDNKERLETNWNQIQMLRKTREL